MAQHVKYPAHSRCSIKAHSCSLIPYSPVFSCMIVLFSDLTFFSMSLLSSYIQTSQEARNILTALHHLHVGGSTASWMDNLWMEQRERQHPRVSHTWRSWVAVALCSGLLTRHCFTKSMKLSDHSSGFRNVGGGLVGIMKMAWLERKKKKTDLAK